MFGQRRMASNNLRGKEEERKENLDNSFLRRARTSWESSVDEFAQEQRGSNGIFRRSLDGDEGVGQTEGSEDEVGKIENYEGSDMNDQGDTGPDDSGASDGNLGDNNNEGGDGIDGAASSVIVGATTAADAGSEVSDEGTGPTEASAGDANGATDEVSGDATDELAAAGSPPGEEPAPNESGDGTEANAVDESSNSKKKNKKKKKAAAAAAAAAASTAPGDATTQETGETSQESESTPVEAAATTTLAETTTTTVPPTTTAIVSTTSESVPPTTSTEPDLPITTKETEQQGQTGSGGSSGDKKKKNNQQGGTGGVDDINKDDDLWNDDVVEDDGSNIDEPDIVTEEELAEKEREFRLFSASGAVLSLLAMIFTAYQMSENPDGIYAAMCRLFITIFGLIFRIIMSPCKGLFGFPNRHSHYGHVPVSTMDYGYRDPSVELQLQ